MTGCRVRKTVLGAFVLFWTLFCDLCFPSTTLWRARVSFVIPNRTTHHHHHAAAKQKRKENSQILAKKERKKQSNRQTNEREREKEKKREQSYCEPAAPRPGSRVSNRYHRSVGKNQSPGAFVVVGFVFRRALPSLTVNILLP